ncbi:sensor histidine kinase [Ruania halotolerans]|uniref:sensor histidine kinase n=1 Tax=Ruania halotolerans TaxID=2897773 RepID=UPI001E4D266A|nr:histidine kinase [Ruania halotolerans]UFU05780.1 histidine kinase [Ruania halotolerans]
MGHTEDTPIRSHLGTTWTFAVLGVATVLTTATVLARSASAGGGAAWTVLDGVVGVLALMALALALRYPAAGAVVIACLAAASPAATAASTIATLVVAQRHRLVPAALIGAAGVLAHVVQAVARPVAGITMTWWVLLTLTAYAALIAWGAFAQARWALMGSLRERARRAELDAERRLADARLAERTRIAREMHDVLAHRLSLVATAAGALEYRPDGPPEQMAIAAGTVRRGVHEALEELREVIGVLRADEVVDSGPLSRRRPPDPGVADLPTLVDEARAAGSTVTTQIEVDGPVPTAVGRPVYRIIQEGLTNARKHAAGCPVHVQLTGIAGGSLSVEISNPLRARSADVPGSGAGLVGLAERAELAGGAIEIETGGGVFRLRARIPWPDE